MMKYFVGIALVLLIGKLIFGKMYLHIKYKKNNGGDSIAVQVFLGKFFRIYSVQRKNINIVDTFLHKLLSRLGDTSAAGPGGQAESSPKSQPVVTSVWEKITKLRSKNLKLLNLRFSQMQCQVKLAAGDAAQTAILFGCLQAVRGVALELLDSYAIFCETPQIAILPDFNTTEKEVYVDCIVSLKIGNIIHMLKFYAIMQWREKYG